MSKDSVAVRLMRSSYGNERRIMELVTKIIITVLVILVGVKVLHRVWTSQIDVKATVRKFVTQEPKIAETLVTRDPNKLYQNGVAVADITGPVQTNGSTVLFTQLANVSGLDKDQPIEYKRFKLRVMQVQTIIGMKVVTSDRSSRVLHNVMEGVTCKVLK